MVNKCSTLFFFVKKERKRVLSLVLGLAFSVFSVFCFWLSSFAKKTRKEEDAFLATKRRERLMTALFSIHTTPDAHQHHHHGFYYCFKYRSRRDIICESSFSLVIDSSSFFSLSLSLRARMRAVLASRLFTPLFYPFLKKCIITHRRNNNHNNSEPKLSLARPHRRRALSP